MKRLILTIIVASACATAFAQGRISFQTDSLHLVYYTLSPENGSFAGQPLSATNMPLGFTLVADLYLGTSSRSLALITTTTFGISPGKWNTVNITTGNTGPAIPGGTTVFIVTQIRDSASIAPATWTPDMAPFGSSGFYATSPEFTFVLGTSSLAYPPMYATGSSLGGGFCTWPVGTYNMDYVSAGFRGAIGLTRMPEPSILALAGLGAAATLILRRRKWFGQT